MSDHDQPETCRECKVMHYDGRGHVCQHPVSDTWTPEQMRSIADQLYNCDNWLRQWAVAQEDNVRLRERVTALEANLATVDALRQAAEASKVELAGRVTALEAELKTTDELLVQRQGVLDAIPECPVHGACVPHALEWIKSAKASKTQLATLTAEHERLTARWEALRAWAQARYDETENLDDVANWAYERMMGRMNILERGDDHP